MHSTPDLLQRYGLVVENVPGDGNCLFHCFSQFEPVLTMQEWRNALCDRLAEKAAETQSSEYWLKRGNDALKETLIARQKETYSSLESLLDAMRKDEWGYGDFITAFCLEIQGEVFCWHPNGDVSHYRPPEVKVVLKTHFMINEANTSGNMLQCPCVFLLCVCGDVCFCVCVMCVILCVSIRVLPCVFRCVLCVLKGVFFGAGIPCHFNPLKQKRNRTALLVQLIQDRTKLFISSQQGEFIDQTKSILR